MKNILLAIAGFGLYDIATSNAKLGGIILFGTAFGYWAYVLYEQSMMMETEGI